MSFSTTMHRCVLLRNGLHVAGQRLHAARSFRSYSTLQRLPLERRGLNYQTRIVNNTTKRSFSGHGGLALMLTNDIKRSVNNRSSPINEHERWKELSVEEQQFVAPDLLDAWIRYHAELLKTYSNERETETTTISESKLLEIIDSAHRAHSVLDRLYHKWSPRRFGGSSLEEEKEDPVAVMRANQILALWASTSEAGYRVSKKELRGIPQRAQFLWQQLPKATESSNALLRTWAYSHEHWRGTRAQSIFDEIPNPDADSYRLMIRAWAWSGERRGAFTATGFLRRMLRLLDQQNTNMEPSIDEYRIVLDSWTRAKDQHAPEKALSVMNLLDHALDRGTTFVQFDTNCYRSILVTASRRPTLPDLGKLVDRVLKRMGEWFLVPDTICYGSAIRTWKNEALNPNTDPVFRAQAVHRVLELLEEMDVAYNQSSTIQVRPTTSIYNDVLEALTVDGQRFEQAEKLLLVMEQSSSPLEKPDKASYCHILRMLKSRHNGDKVARAKDILERFYRNRDENKSSHSAHEQIAVLNEFIEVCASANVKSDTEGRDLLGEILNAVQATRHTQAINPDSNSFASLLKACQSLILSLPTRQKFAERIFDLCRDAGMVNKTVLVEFKKTVSSDLFIDIVVSSCRELGGNRAIPAEWNRNAFGGKVCSADGSRSPPLSADGEVIVTNEMSDFRFRRLRDKRKRNSIRGGRLPKPPKFGTLEVL